LLGSVVDTDTVTMKRTSQEEETQLLVSQTLEQLKRSWQDPLKW
jgi:hypothetical protein